jgi:23S rRNA (guanine745-N1)-methyltransferase
MKKKIDLAKKVIEDNLSVFRCPICKQQMTLQQNSLLCENGHCFDLSKNGYLNLLRNPVNSKYNKNLFFSRRKILQNGFLKKLIAEISKLILRDVSNKKCTDLKILDAGCGEGTNLVNIARYIFEQSNTLPVGIGLDISKEGIYIAASAYPGYIWLVSDIANIPIKAKQCDFIINILSPANYSEFARVLKDNGFLIKIIPGAHYLQEIRLNFYQQHKKMNYSNEKVVRLFKKNFTVINQQRLSFHREIKRHDILPLMNMTPLSWNIEREELDIASSGFSEIDSITVDLDILIGKK